MGSAARAIAAAPPVLPPSYENASRARAAAPPLTNATGAQSTPNLVIDLQMLPTATGHAEQA